jgi:predicted nuclease with RNAse H fold
LTFVVLAALVAATYYLYKNGYFAKAEAPAEVEVKAEDEQPK